VRLVKSAGEGLSSNGCRKHNGALLWGVGNDIHLAEWPVPFVGPQ
jgi:hypothetical protein